MNRLYENKTYTFNLSEIFHQADRLNKLEQWRSEIVVSELEQVCDAFGFKVRRLSPKYLGKLRGKLFKRGYRFIIEDLIDDEKGIYTINTNLKKIVI